MKFSDPSNPWNYTRQQRLGLVALITVIVVCILIARALENSEPAFPVTEDRDLFKAAERLRVASSVFAETVSEPHPDLSFDPNSISQKELIRLGLSAKQAAAWIKYREKRPFREVTDIGKLYVLRPEQAERLQSLAVLPALAPAKPRRPPSVAEVKRSRERFPFDPNTIPEDSLLLLGFTQREASALIKYRSYRPVTFRSPEDLTKVNALNLLTVNEVKELIHIKAEPLASAPAAPPKNAVRAAPEVIDVNTASFEDWQQLPGVGAYRAERIINFRDKLGGFAEVGQVATTYGLPDSVFLAMKPYLTVGPIRRPLYVNQLDAAGLASHPYLKRSTATVMVRYRDNHGPFNSVEDLEKIRALSTETLDALLPYLNFDP